MQFPRLTAGAALLLTTLFQIGSLQANPQLNLYSARHYDADEALYQAFTAATGIQVRVLQGDSDQLIERIRREGRASPADVLITVDAGRLWRAEQAGILAPVNSALLQTRIPAHLRHPDNLWFGFSTRLRLIFYNKAVYPEPPLSRYEDLADARFRGQLCIRSSNNVYNQSMLAAMLVANGPEATLTWSRQMLANLARPVQGGDTDQIRGVAAGECDLAVANHYYFLRLALAEDPAQRTIADQVGLIFPNQQDRGVHVNVGGAGMLKHAPNPAHALAFLEFLASDAAQALFASGSYEFPVVADVPLHPALAQWQHLVMDEINVSLLGSYNAEAVRIADRAGWR